MRFKAYASSSAGNLYSVEAADGTRLLLECGLPLRQIQAHLGHTLSGVAGVLATHSHKDHSWAAKDLLRRGVPVYCSAGTALELGLSGLFGFNNARGRTDPAAGGRGGATAILTRISIAALSPPASLRSPPSP